MTVMMPIIDIILWALIGGYVAFLANRGIALFQIEMRSASLDYLDNKITSHQLIKIALAAGASFLLSVALPNSLVTGVVLIHAIFIFTDMVGTYFKKSWGNSLLAIILGSLFAVSFASMVHFFRYIVVETNFFPNMEDYLFYSVDHDNLLTYFRIGILMVPALGMGIQFGPKQSVHASLSTLVIYLGVTVLSGFTLFGLDIRLPIDPYETTVTIMFAFFLIKATMQQGKESTHHELAIRSQPLIRRIQLNYIWLMISGALLATAASRLMFGIDVFSLALLSVNLPYVAVIVMLVLVLGELSALYSSFSSTGIYHPFGSGLVIVVGILLHILLPDPFQMIVAFIFGALIMFFELHFLNQLSVWLDRMKGLRKMGENTHVSMTLIFDFTLIIGGMPIAQAVFPTVGPLVLFGFWIINRNMKKKFISTYGLVPIVIILLGIVATLFEVIS